MANVLELFALVEMTGCTIKPHPAMNALSEQVAPEPTIKRIIRTYESDTRAQVDMELLEEVSPGPYAIVKTIHVES